MSHDVFAHDTYCGACGKPESAHASILRCERCPAVFHYPCSGYYDEKDGPSANERWLCFRCARDAGGGLKKNWSVTRGKARLCPGDRVYIAAAQDDDTASDLFYRGIVVSCHPTFVKVRWEDFMQDESNPEAVPKDSYRLWHGAMDEDLWEDMGDYAFAPISRRLCPDTFAEIAEANRVPDRTAQRRMKPSGATGSSMRRAVPLPTSGSESSCPQPRGPLKTAAQLQKAADEWLVAVREFGESIGDRLLAEMPVLLSMRRDMELHPYALWVIVQSWGGQAVVHAHKLWSRVAKCFHAPTTMTNRSSKMMHLWRDYNFQLLVGPDAAAAGVEQPQLEQRLLKTRSHYIVQQWPDSLVVSHAKRKRAGSLRDNLRGALCHLLERWLHCEYSV